MDEQDRIPICIVQQDQEAVDSILGRLNDRKFNATVVRSVDKATRLISPTAFQLVIIDVHMENDSGWTLLENIHTTKPGVVTIVVTPNPSLEGAVKSMKLGALEYFDGNLDSSRFRQIFDDLWKNRDSLMNRQLSKGSEETHPHGILTTSKVMKAVFRQINQAASSTETVLIQGESGTGKELIARAIHYSSSRGGEPFIPVNCGAIPDNLLESELFGHVQGSYTGAERTRNGFFQTADNGTIFLDEIAETSLQMQAKLLRVLEGNQVWKLGAREPDSVNVRIIAATNKNLRQNTQNGTFREDLFYRFHVIAIHVPPLRERTGDIKFLTRHFLNKFAREWNKPVPNLTEEVWEILMKYQWPGNVRELENTVKQIVLMSVPDEIVQKGDLPEGLEIRYHRLNPKPSLASLEQIEKQHIEQIIDATGWNKSKAARILGITAKTLRSKLDKYHITPQYERSA